jgi:hypothetical protein
VNAPHLDEGLVVGDMSEHFNCSRCGYARLLKAGEDGFRLYLLHEGRCNQSMGQQLWLPCITEDALDWNRPDERMHRLRLLLSKSGSSGTKDLGGVSGSSASSDVRKAA